MHQATWESNEGLKITPKVFYRYTTARSVTKMINGDMNGLMDQLTEKHRDG